MGYKCYAFEENRIFLYFLKKLKRIERKQFKIISNLFNNNQEIAFDIILALEGFQKCLKTEDSLQKLKNFLNRLKVKELICGFYPKKGFQNSDFSYKFTNNEFITFIINNSCFNTYKIIGKTKNHKLIYKFTT